MQANTRVLSHGMEVNGTGGRAGNSEWGGMESSGTEWDAWNGMHGMELNRMECMEWNGTEWIAWNGMELNGMHGMESS